LRQTQLCIIVDRPLSEVYKATVSVLSHLGTSTLITPMLPPSADQRESRIIYIDNEPLFYNKKPIGMSPKASKDDIGIYVSILMESHSLNTTALYIYHHNNVRNTSAEVQTVVDANMAYRGRILIYRLDTQLRSEEKWPWITK
jgi:hypothetical protein